MRIIKLLCFLITPLLSFGQHYSLNDFYSNNNELNKNVDSIYNSISSRQRIGQMIVTSYGINGRPSEVIDKLLEAGDIGGVIYMKGTHDTHLSNTLKLNHLNSGLPLMYSMDAEPSLLGGRISSLPKVLKTKDIKTIHDNDSITKLICNELNAIGVNLNYAPDCDLSTSNAAIGSRSYGSKQGIVVKMANSFINTSANHNILTCAKHFPGHGLVVGDSHFGRVKISGEMKELEVYKELIKNPKLYSIMIGHINVEKNEKYNTMGLPSSCSPVIIKELLKKELGFKGLVISDGLGMHALKSVGIPGFEASKAGCDILCMPSDEVEVIEAILNEIKSNRKYAQQIEQSVKKIIRMKFCLGLFEKPNQNEKVILYQHGKIIEEQGVNAYHPKYGEYEFKRISEAFEQNGFKVINNLRGANANAEYHAMRISQQVDSLLLQGYLAQNITILGASKGAWISLLASSKLSTNEVNVVSLAICGNQTTKYFKENGINVKGRWLSIFDESDELGKSCQGINKSFTIEFKEIRIKTGKKHGVVFKALEDWIKPTVEWAGMHYIKPKIYVNDQIWLQHLKDSIFIHTSIQNPEGVSSNGMTVIKNGEAIIIGTPMDENSTKSLIHFLELSWNIKVKKYVLDHFQIDSTRSVKYLSEHGIECLANKKTAKLYKKNKYPVPSIAFRDSLTISFNGLAIKLWSTGVGPAKDNTLVWLPSSEILFGGSLIKIGMIQNVNYRSNTVLKDWCEAKGKEFITPKQIVPGYGPIGGKDLFEFEFLFIKWQ